LTAAMHHRLPLRVIYDGSRLPGTCPLHIPSLPNSCTATIRRRTKRSKNSGNYRDGRPQLRVPMPPPAEADQQIAPTPFREPRKKEARNAPSSNRLLDQPELSTASRPRSAARARHGRGVVGSTLIRIGAGLGCRRQAALDKACCAFIANMRRAVRGTPSAVRAPPALLPGRAIIRSNRKQGAAQSI
jgi:hypothetical protein